jgi:hypothetical protein
LRKHRPTTLRIGAPDEQVTVKQRACSVGITYVAVDAHDVGRRADRQDQIARNLDLRSSDIGASGANESVEVRQLDMVSVHQYEIGNAEVGELLRYDRACPTDSDNANAQEREPQLTVNAKRANLPIVHVVERQRQRDSVDRRFGRRNVRKHLEPKRRADRGDGKRPFGTVNVEKSRVGRVEPDYETRVRHVWNPATEGVEQRTFTVAVPGRWLNRPRECVGVNHDDSGPLCPRTLHYAGDDVG